MNNLLKKNLRIVAERFHHQINYDKRGIVLSNNINAITLWSTKKDTISLSYNLEDKIQVVILSVEVVYDAVLSLLYRKTNTEELKIGEGFLLTIKEWIKEEGTFAQKQLNQLKQDLEKNITEYRMLGGNRYEAVYFDGIILLTDDLCWAKANVIEIKY